MLTLLTEQALDGTQRLTHDGVRAIGGGRAGGGAVVVGRAATAAAAATARSVEAGHWRKAGADVCRRVRGVALQQHQPEDTHGVYVLVEELKPKSTRLNLIGPTTTTHFLHKKKQNKEKKPTGVSVNGSVAD